MRPLLKVGVCLTPYHLGRRSKLVRVSHLQSQAGTTGQHSNAHPNVTASILTWCHSVILGAAGF